MGNALDRAMTVDEFLVWDDGTDMRYELVDGRLRAMGYPHQRQGTIVINLGAILKRRLPRGCRPVAEGGIRPVENRNFNYFQADLVVTCEGRANDTAWVDQPVLIVEVLSKDSAAHDRGRKTPDYVQIPSVQEVLLIDGANRRVQLWSRRGDSWLVRDYIGDADIPLACIDGTIGLDDIYDGV